jgi:hypothetical protein
MAVLVVLGACSRRDVDKEYPRALPVQEVADTRPKVAECDGGMCKGACLDLASDPNNCGACEHACDAGACVVGMCTRAIGWGENVRTLSPGVPCSIGARFSVHCPSNVSPPKGPLWGTDLYTADSAICVAAMHAGLVTAAGGDAAIEIYAGAPSYVGSLRNGLTSSTWAAYDCSYRFVTTMGCEPPTSACGGRCSDLMTDRDDCGSCGTKCGPDESCRKGKCSPGIDATWTTTASDRSCKFTALPVYTYVCPPAVGSGSVWGTGIYTHDSAICTAAVHAGKITLAAGGTVTIAMHPGMSSYKGSTANGITTASYGPWPCAYEFR